MKKKNHSGKKFNILLSVVALVLIVAVGGAVTFSWIEKSTTLDIRMHPGDIQRIPGGNTAYKHQITLDKSATNTVSLNDYVDKVDEIMLSPVSSADGINFFMKSKGDTTKRAGTTSDANVNYISFDFDVTATSATNLYFEDGKNENDVQDLVNHPTPSFTFGSSSTQAKSVRVAFQVNSGTPMVFSSTGEQYDALTSTSGTTAAVTPKTFESYQYGNKALCSLAANTQTKIRITIWIEGTDANLNSEYVGGSKLNMKLMLTTPWPKSASVTLIDKTANAYLTNGSGTLTVNGNTMTQTETGKFAGKISMTDSALTFKYTDGSLTYVWSAGSKPNDNSTYTVFDYNTTAGYGKWDVAETEQINIIDALVGTNLAYTGHNAMDYHIKVSTDGTNYYRSAYDTDVGGWKVNIDTSDTKLYVQYLINSGNELVYKWDAASTRTDKSTMSTYYLIGYEGGTSSYSTGTWVNEYDVYFYDGTADVITSNCTGVSYVAYSGTTEKQSGSMVLDSAYRYKTPTKLKYSDKIDKVVFTLGKTASNGADEIQYVWTGSGKVNTDIYYTANSYTKD